MFERVISRLDVATGQIAISSSYKTEGSPKSTFVEGNSTIQFEVVNSTATYNTTTNTPNPPSMMSKRRAPKHVAKVFKPLSFEL